MSRIRSIHPGFYTDEQIVSVSMAARLLLLGLGIEADDKGIFEWKPITLKMRLFPVDNVDVTELLAELEAAELVRKYDFDGKNYGAIRNFRRHQSPKSPNDIHPIPDDFRNWVGLTHPIGEMDRDKVESFPQKGEKSPQMERRGEERSSVAIATADSGAKKTSRSRKPQPPPEKPKSVALIDPAKVMFEAGIALFAEAGIEEFKARSNIGRWRSIYRDDALILNALTAAKREGALQPIPFIERCLRNATERQSNPDAKRGPRPDPAVDLARRAAAQAETERAVGGDPEDRGWNWDSLPAYLKD